MRKIYAHHVEGLDACASVMESFEHLHRAQLQAIGFPHRLLPRLFSKFNNSKPEDLSDVFQITPSDAERHSVTGKVVKSRGKLQPQADVYVLQHIWSSDGGQGGREALLSNLALLEEVGTGLGIPLPWEERKTVMEQMMTTVCQQTEKSKVVARQALTESGYDLVGAILQANDLSEEDLMAQRGNKTPSLTMEEFRKGLEGVCKGGGEAPEAQLKAMYEDWKDRKLQEPKKDSEGWVQCDHYKWKEEEEGVIAVSISVPLHTQKRDIISNMTSRQWRFAVKKGGKDVVLIEGEFPGQVVVDESFWTVEGGCVSVSVQTVEGEGWRELIVGEVQGEGVGREEMVFCVEEVMSRMKHLNLFYSAVTNEGKIYSHPVISESNEYTCPGEQPQVWYLMEPLGLALVHSQTPNFACHPFAKSVHLLLHYSIYTSYREK